jgi:transcriptional regulator with XRE-family HTH domain
MHGTTTRLLASIPEQRRDLGLSLRELARLSGVSRPTIAKLEAGRPVDEALAMRLAVTLTVFELYSEPEPVREPFALAGAA